MRKIPLWVALGLWLLAACSPSATLSPSRTPAPSPTPGWTLTPYVPPSATPTSAPLPSPTLPPAARPSPTPWFYTIAKGDTLLGIALRFGVTLKELQEANPGINPRALPVGERLIIPTNADNPAGLPTPTPLPLQVGAPLCAPSADGGAVCLVNVTNPGPQAVEAVAVWLAMPGGETATAEALLDMLPAGKSTVAVARFPTAPARPRAAARLLRALPLASKDAASRYPPVQVKGVHITLQASKRQAQVSGSVQTHSKAPIRALWVLAVAYDAQGQPVGARRWEAASPAAAQKAQPFSFTVYSVGPPIARVVITAEAHALAGTPSP